MYASQSRYKGSNCQQLEALDCVVTLLFNNVPTLTEVANDTMVSSGIKADALEPRSRGTYIIILRMPLPGRIS